MYINTAQATIKAWYAHLGVWEGLIEDLAAAIVVLVVIMDACDSAMKFWEVDIETRDGHTGISGCYAMQEKYSGLWGRYWGTREW